MKNTIPKLGYILLSSLITSEIPWQGRLSFRYAIALENQWVSFAFGQVGIPLARGRSFGLPICQRTWTAWWLSERYGDDYCDLFPKNFFIVSDGSALINIRYWLVIIEYWRSVFNIEKEYIIASPIGSSTLNTKKTYYAIRNIVQ